MSSSWVRFDGGGSGTSAAPTSSGTATTTLPASGALSAAVSAPATGTGTGSQWVQFEQKPPVLQQPAPATTSDPDAYSAAILLPTFASAPRAQVANEELVPRPLTFSMPAAPFSPMNPFVKNSSSTAAGGQGFVAESTSPTTLAQPHAKDGDEAAKGAMGSTGTGPPLGGRELEFYSHRRREQEFMGATQRTSTTRWCSTGAT